MSLENTTLSSFYNTDFEKKFLKINFDNMLRESNSKFINEKLYLEAKHKYYENTKENYNSFKKYKLELDNLLNSEIYYIDSEQKINKNKNVLKNILIQQELAYQNFLNHIKFLQSI